MNVLVWNCQGIVNRKTRHALKVLVQQHQVHMIFLSETHCTAEQHNSLKIAIGMPNMIQVEREERFGGLILLWDDTMKVTLRSTQFYFIDVDVVSEEDIQWRFTGFYGHPNTGQRHTTWDLLHSIKGRVGEKWLVTGDFNEILQLNEKSGGCLRDINQMAAFRQTLSNCNLEDMGAAEGPYTWSNSSTKEIKVRSGCLYAEVVGSFCHTLTLGYD